MAVEKGQKATIKVGAATVGKALRYRETPGANTDTASYLGDDHQTVLGTSRTHSATIECHYDPADPGQTALLVEGAQVTLELYPQGEDTGLPKFTITGATIVSLEWDIDGENYGGVTVSTEGGDRQASVQP